jgi:hypothetical protein
MDLSSFEKWYPLDGIAINHLHFERFVMCVYVFRMKNTKEWLYIGSTGNLVYRLLGQYFAGAGSSSTTQRIQALLLEEGFIKDTEVSWVETPDYKIEEKRLLESYEKEHGKLPRWNKRG